MLKHFILDYSASCHKFSFWTFISVTLFYSLDFFCWFLLSWDNVIPVVLACMPQQLLTDQFFLKYFLLIFYFFYKFFTSSISLLSIIKWISSKFLNTSVPLINFLFHFWPPHLPRFHLLFSTLPLLILLSVSVFLSKTLLAWFLAWIRGQIVLNLRLI